MKSQQTQKPRVRARLGSPKINVGLFARVASNVKSDSRWQDGVTHRFESTSDLKIKKIVDRGKWLQHDSFHEFWIENNCFEFWGGKWAQFQGLPMRTRKLLNKNTWLNPRGHWKSIHFSSERCPVSSYAKGTWKATGDDQNDKMHRFDSTSDLKNEMETWFLRSQSDVK